MTAGAKKDAQLPLGTRVVEMTSHHDHRGTFTEVFRVSWGLGVDPVQWNLVRSEAGVLRGVHVHPRHDDYLMVVEGAAVVGLRDLRAGSPTEGLAATLDLGSESLRALLIPHGVAHGFCFPGPAQHLYAVSHYWDPADELACRWDDPGLELAWPIEEPRLSDRDASAGSLSELLRELEPWQPIGPPDRSRESRSTPLGAAR